MNDVYVLRKTNRKVGTIVCPSVPPMYNLMAHINPFQTIVQTFDSLDYQTQDTNLIIIIHRGINECFLRKLS